MPRRPNYVLAVRATAVAGLAALACIASVPGAEPSGTQTSSGLLASADLPPLPPRDAQPRSVAPRRTTESTSSTTAVIDVVITASPTPAAPSVAPLGWENARVEAAGRSRLAALELTAGHMAVDAAATESRVASALTLVEPDAGEAALPLLDTGVFRSEALFDGVPVLASDLAPIPTGLGDDAVAADMAAILALAPQPLTLPPRIADAGLLAPMPIDGGSETAAAAPAELTPQQLDQISAATAELHKPVGAISLTGALGKREPPDQSATTLPIGMPQTIWGQPWPDVRLSCYRYTVPFSHRPLYFEQPNFERCGESWWCLSPYVSATHFFGSAVLLPLHMVIDPPCRCVPTLGDCPTCHERYGLCPTLNRSR